MLLLNLPLVPINSLDVVVVVVVCFSLGRAAFLLTKFVAKFPESTAVAFLDV